MNTWKHGLLALGLTGAGLAQANTVNVYNWSDYIAPTTVPGFSKQTGVKVNYNVYDSMETLNAKLMTGRSGFDLVVPSNNVLGLGIKAGLFQPLDKSKLPNYKNIDPALLKMMEVSDPGNKYAVPYFWGVITLGINEEKVKKALGGKLPANEWDLLFKPEYVSKLKSCGVSILDSPSEFFPMALHYFGKDPGSTKEADYRAIMPQLNAIRASVTRISSSGYINDMASGEVCLAMGYGGDLNIAKRRAVDAKNGVKVVPLMPKQGVAIWVDSMAIPKDAKNVANALSFINYSLDPKIAADNANTVTFAPGSLPARQFVNKQYLNDRSIFPNAEDLKNSFIQKSVGQETLRIYGRLWQNFKLGRS
ncbi:MULTISPECIES: polyamine ABC transporter substrate-binding protein [Chromobacterium]|uniref:Putrescine-binding periplasmic protein n=1 Tax=Chromobacterium rhizoryzae TaxID=1778675 RepID=A0AAD0RPH2_9NEIS|nr:MULTISPECIES: polyamine ABC transporter substrate-binding protein [Chromobacterium]AXT46307.1 polyamine ABC transporter substrate-binding protein [Chromobacterium rhizoryzae]QOD84639.1 polyamine ABC transporter substrate-binding protein [Chromobacterium haemolyticum]